MVEIVCDCCSMQDVECDGCGKKVPELYNVEVCKECLEKLMPDIQIED